MDSNPINEGISSGRIETTDDVEGHAVRSGRIVEPEPQDVEGHGFRGNVTDEDDADTEGHGVRPRI